MIERTAAIAATAPATPATAAPAAKGARTFADEFRFAASTEKAAKAEQRPDGEKTKGVSGHPYARILNGDDKGLYLNQLEGSPREGSAFKKVARDDRVFHAYGTGKDRVIVEVKAKTAADTDTGKGTTTTGGTGSTPGTTGAKPATGAV